MELKNQTEKIIQDIKEKIYNETNIGGTRFGYKDEDGGRHIRLCDGGVLSMECKDRK